MKVYVTEEFSENSVGLIIWNEFPRVFTSYKKCLQHIRTLMEVDKQLYNYKFEETINQKSGLIRKEFKTLTKFDSKHVFRILEMETLN